MINKQNDSDNQAQRSDYFSRIRSFTVFSEFQRCYFPTARWAPLKRHLAQHTNTDIRQLPIYRVYEHADAGCWAPIANSLITCTGLTKAEYAVLTTLCLIGTLEHPMLSQLPSLFKIRYEDVKPTLQSLVAKKVLVNDYQTFGKRNRKELWHISHPAYWEIEGFPREQFLSSLGKARFDPNNWTPRTFSKAIERMADQDQAFKDCGGYVKVPRMLADINLSNTSKYVWTYIAHLPKTYHPDALQMASQTGLCDKTILKSLSELQYRDMLVFKDYRHNTFGASLERSYHTVHPSLWWFPESARYKQKPEASILYNPEMIQYISQTVFRRITDGIPEDHRRYSGGSQTVFRRITDGIPEDHRRYSGGSQTVFRRMARTLQLLPSLAQLSSRGPMRLIIKRRNIMTLNMMKKSVCSKTHHHQVVEGRFGCLTKTMDPRATSRDL